MAARDNVVIRMSAEDAGAFEAWRKAAKGPEEMGAAIDKTAQKSRNLATEAGEFLSGMIGKWTSVAGAVGLVTAAIQRQYEAEKALRELRTKTTDTVDVLMNRFQVQSQIKSGPEADRYRSQILATAANRRIDPQVAFTVAEQMVSSGVNAKDTVYGGGLDEMLQLLGATNAGGGDFGDPRDATKSFIRWLTANNLAPNQKNIRSQAVAFQRLFAGTNVQLSELTQIAPAASVIKSFAHTSPEQSLSIASRFLDLTDVENSMTAFRTAVTRLGTGASNSEIMRGMKMLNVKPGEVDFQGESFDQVIERLQGAFGKVDGATANSAARLIFGRAGLPFYTTMMQPDTLGDVRRRMALTGDEAGYRETVGIYESGRASAARQATSLAAATQHKEKAGEPETVQKRLQTLLMLYGLSDSHQARILQFYEDPIGPDSLYDMTTEGKIGRAASQIDLDVSTRHRAILRQAGKSYMNSEQEQEFVRGQLRGTIPIRIVGPDGLDIPTEPAAAGLNQ